MLRFGIIEVVGYRDKAPGILLLTVALVVSLACNSPASPASHGPSPEPTLFAPPPSPTPNQTAPSLTQPSGPAPAQAAVVDTSPRPTSTTNPGADRSQALMASALDSMPHFHLFGNDVDLPEFGRVSVNLDYVAGKMAESGDIALVPILVEFLRV